MSTSRYQGRWAKDPDGPLTLEQALAFAKSRGVDVPDDVEWCVVEHEGMTLREAGLEREGVHGKVGADASYFRTPPGATNANARVKWDQLKTIRGSVMILLRAEVLASREHILYVISHELFELRELKQLFDVRGSMTYRELAFLIEPEFDGAVHRNAVRYADELVRALRAEGEPGP